MSAAGLRLFVIYVLPTLLTILTSTNYYWDYLLGEDCCTDEVFDFIVVGAGSAGAVVANRLSKNNKVLLIEAGGEPVYFNSIPGFAPAMLNQPATDWMLQTEPQQFALKGMPEKRARWPRGKLLGGTSNLNYMFYVRGHPLDYDNWANMTGDSGWSYENVLPYFKKSIDYHGQYASDERHYGSSPYGYLRVEPRKFKPLHQHFVDAGKELGLPELDQNGEQREGISLIEVNQKNGQRFGAYQAFLKDFTHRETLKISKFSHATKIQLDKNKRAVGVWFEKHGEMKFAKVSKEVVVSAGAVGSPKLLMLSGIGPKEHLKSVGIKPKVDLPVGKNLKDHFIYLALPFLINDTVTFMTDRDLGPQTLIDYHIFGTGALTAPTGCHSQAFVTSSLAKKVQKDWSDIQMYLAAAGTYKALAEDWHGLSNVRADLAEKYLARYVGKDSFIFVVNLARVKSAGELKLASKEPTANPLINPMYLSHPDDVKVLVEGFKLIVKIAEETKSFQRLNASFAATHFPGCEQFRLKSDEYYECYIRTVGSTLYHHCGTCSMGRGPKDPKAVLDSELRVLHTTGLRVADASVFPDIPNGNINTPTVMVGEKGADMIREYWAKQYLVCNRMERLQKVAYGNKCYYSKSV